MLDTRTSSVELKAIGKKNSPEGQQTGTD